MSAIVSTFVPLIETSQAPRKCAHQRAIRAAGVLASIEARRRQPFFSSRCIPAVRWVERSHLRRSISCSKACPKGSGDIYIVAMSWGPMRYSVTQLPCRTSHVARLLSSKNYSRLTSPSFPQLLCRTSQVARLLSSKKYSRRNHIGIYVGIQEILSSKSNTSSSINRSEHPAAGRRVKSTPTLSFKSGYK